MLSTVHRVHRWNERVHFVCYLPSTGCIVGMREYISCAFTRCMQRSQPGSRARSSGQGPVRTRSTARRSGPRFGRGVEEIPVCGGRVRIRKAHEMYSLPIQAGRTVDRRDSTRNPLFLGVRSELLVRTGGGSKSHSDNWGDTPHRVECSASEQWRVTRRTPRCRVFLFISRFRFSLLRRVPLA